jgi:D-alanine-D-alanine ligase
MKKKIAVLMGGPSPEYEVSLQSGENVIRNLDRSKFDISGIVVSKDGRFPVPPRSLRKFDLAFIAMHGPFGEDGTIQAILDEIGVVFTGSEAAASRLGMDKIASKNIFIKEGIPTADFRVVESVGGIKDPAESFGLPLMIKPSNQGSSVGVSIVRTPADFPKAFAEAARFGPVIAEKFVQGKEIQAGILEEKLLPLIEIRPRNEFFDYAAKYTPNLSEEITPAPLDEQTTKRIQQLAIRAFKILGCRHLGRVDLFLTEDGTALVSEVNTIPGLTENSLFPKEAAAAGIPAPELFEKIIGLALADVC